MKKALASLSILAEEPGGLTLKELSRRLGTSAATMSRLTSVLKGAGFISRRQDSRSFVLGPRLLEFGASALHAFPVAELAIEPMGEAARTTKRTVYLGVPSDDGVLFLHSVSLYSNVAVASIIGHSLPFHASAAGKVVLAYRSEHDIEALFESKLDRYTPHTVVQPSALRAELDAARTKGYAEACEEYSLGLCGISAPVFDHTRRVNATVTFGQLTAVEHTPTLTTELVSVLQKCASDISSRLGYVQRTLPVG